MEFFHTHVSKLALEEVSRVLLSGRLSEGPVVQRFEAALEERLGLLGPVAVNSGTTALHLALALLGVGPKDEVILPPQTFVATALVVLMQGATPVFCDIDPLTGNLCKKDLPRHISERTAAIMPVHWAGYPCDLDEINAIAKAGPKGPIPVIEDAAHALGATYKGRPIGAISQMTAFSFQAIKHLTTGDGGLLCCTQSELYNAARRRRWFGIDRLSDKADLLGERVYDLKEVGFKYHMNDLCAALGLGNLHDFPARLLRRRRIAARYREALAQVNGLSLLREEPDRQSAHWLFTVLCERRGDFIRALSSRGVPASVVHLRIDRNTLFGGVREDLVGQGRFNERQVALPLHEGLADEDVERVITAVRAGW